MDDFTSRIEHRSHLSSESGFDLSRTNVEGHQLASLRLPSSTLPRLTSVLHTFSTCYEHVMLHLLKEAGSARLGQLRARKNIPVAVTS